MPFQHLTHDPVLMLLLVMSLTSWALIVERWLALRRVRRADEMYKRGQQAAGAALSMLRAELDKNADAGRSYLLTVMDAAINLQRERVERSLPLLGVIGSTAPYVGLLGTVIGIIQAFQSIMTHNNMSTSVVAGGIATALVATAMGLAVAIPSVAAHHLLTSAINRVVSGWEATVAAWLPDHEGKEVSREPLPLA